MAKVQARKKWNKTDYQISEGKTYRFSATGQWTDWYIDIDAKGYERLWLKPFRSLRRFPDGKWFSLIGAIDRDKSTQFDIGSLIEQQATYTATASGTLYCYANDVSFAYVNNKGAINLIVEEQ